MTEQCDRGLLGESQLFKGLSESQIDAVHGCTDVIWFDKGAEITHTDTWGSAAFLIVSGSVTVVDASAKSGYQEPLGPGTFVGELAMLTEVTYAATVVAADAVRALVIERTALYSVLEDDPEIAEHISGKLAFRLSSLAQDLRAVDERFEALETSLQRVPHAA